MTDRVHGRDHGDSLGGELVGAWVQTGPLPQGPVFAELEPVFLLRSVPCGLPSCSAATRQGYWLHLTSPSISVSHPRYLKCAK